MSGQVLLNIILQQTLKNLNKKRCCNPTNNSCQGAQRIPFIIPITHPFSLRVDSIAETTQDQLIKVHSQVQLALVRGVKNVI